MQGETYTKEELGNQINMGVNEKAIKEKILFLKKEEGVIPLEGQPGERKINLEISVSRNFNKVTLNVLEEIVIYSDEEDFRAKIRRLGAVLRDEVFLQHTVIDAESKK